MKIIEREIFDELITSLERKEISLIIGPRQAGKTTLMVLLEDYLKKQNKKTIFLNLDIEADKKYFESQEILLKKIELEIGKSGYVFIDEIQRKENAGLFLKGLYDMRLPYKFIVSGSGSLELKEKIHESLVGRKRIFELGTLNFFEFINFKTDYKYKENLINYFQIEKEKALLYLKEYLNFGGYPRVVLEESLTEKRKVIDDIYQSYLEKDISYLLRIKKLEDLTNLVKALAGQIGELANISELSSTLRISQQTIKKYLWYLEKTFIITKISPFFKNLRKEITKTSKYYFNDLGLRNYALNLFGNIEDLKEYGFLFENFVFNHLRLLIKDTSFKINFWRTSDGAEIDFIINSSQKIIPVEVKFKSFNQPEISRSFRSFIDKYQPEISFIIHLGEKFETKLNKTQIIFLPYYEIRKIKI